MSKNKFLLLLIIFSYSFISVGGKKVINKFSGRVKNFVFDLFIYRKF